MAKKGTITYKNPETGEDTSVEISWKGNRDAWLFDNVGGGRRKYNFEHLSRVLSHLSNSSANVTDKDTLIKYLSDHYKNDVAFEDWSESLWDNLATDVLTFLDDKSYDLSNFTNQDVGFNTPEQQEQHKEAVEYVEQLGQDIPKEAAFNSYWNTMMSLDPGTLGNEMYNRLINAQENAALSNMQLADAQYANLAMQQAQTVKNITDQVRAERMAKLRAGMSEAQIANQDMQLMMSNINALNQQAAEMNTARLQAQQQYNLAQDAAYQEYLNNIQGIGNIGAAMTASDAGDLYQQMLKNMYATGSTPKASYGTVSGTKTNNN